MFYSVCLDQGRGWFDPQIKRKIVFKNIRRQQPVYEIEYETFSGSNGVREVNSAYRSFMLMFEIDIFFDSEHERELMDIELSKLFFIGKPYYIRYDLAPGLRFLVNPVELDVIETDSSYQTYSIGLNVFRGHAESIGTSLDDFSLESTWQFSQGLASEDYSYSHDTSRFIIFNAGDFTVDPREHDLRIKVEGESDGQLNIFNRTTGERFIYHPEFSTRRGDWIELDGIYPKRNGVNRGIDTNHALISLVPGANDIELQNISRVRSEWDFRFLYK